MSFFFMPSVKARRLMVLATVELGIASCAFDARKDFAFRALFTEAGNLDTQAYQRVLTAKFPEGASLASFEIYVRSNRGTCSAKSDVHTWCEIPLRGQFCAASYVGLDVSVASAEIKAIKIVLGGQGC